MTIAKPVLRRLSPLHHELEHGKPAVWSQVADMPVVLAFADAAKDTAAVRKVALVDASALPRLTLKGPKAGALLAEVGLTVPDVIFGVGAAGKGGLVARTGGAEFFIEDGPEDNAVARIHEIIGPFGDKRAEVYRSLRADASFFLTGTLASEVFMQTCGYDFRPVAGTAGTHLVFTRVAGVSCSILPRTISNLPLFQLWLDGTTGIYLWETLLEIVRELGGAAAGLAPFYPGLART